MHSADGVVLNEVLTMKGTSGIYYTGHVMG